MSFPDSDLEVTCRAAFGADATTDPSQWTFTDLTSRHVGNPITISWGLLVGQGSRRSASTVLTLLNDDGWLTALLPTSPWWPYVDVGTPMDVRLRSNTTPWISDTFPRTVASGWGTADSGQPWVGVTGLSTNGSSAQMAFASTNLFHQVNITATHRDTKVMWDASLSTVSTGASHVFGPTLRSDGSGNNYIWAGMEFGVSGAVVWTIRTFLGGHEVIEQQVTQPGLTYTAGQTIRCEVELIGDKLQARAWLASGTKPETWACSVQLTQMTGGKGTTAGLRGWCVPGNTNTLPTTITVDNVSFSQPRYPRIEGYITDVQPSFQPLPDGSWHSVAQISIGGIGSRLENRDAPEWSPLRRSLQKSNLPPKVYWPCEDAEGALSAASAFPGADPMLVNGPAVFSFDVGLNDDQYLHTYGTQSLCSVAAGASLVGRVSSVVGSTQWTVSGSFQQDTPGIGGGITEVRQLEWTTPDGTFARWALVSTMTGYQVRAYNDSAGTVTTVTTSVGFVRVLAAFDVTATQSGGNINVVFYINTVQFATGTVAGTLSGVRGRVTVNPDKVNTTGSVDPYGIRFLAGHVMVHDAATAFALPYYFDGSLLVRADQGWGYEYAHRRFRRLNEEERTPWKVVGNPYDTGTTQLNVQQPGGFTDLLTEAIESESGGLIYEDRFGYTHLPRTERINAPVDLTVDMSTYRRSDGTAATDVLVPKLDPRGPNYVTVKRTSGSESTAAAPEEFRNRRGTITAGPELDVLYDADTAQHASWRVHVYTDGSDANYPSLTLDLAANPDLIDDYLALSLGSRIQRTNQPTIAGLGVIDQIVDQGTETFSPRQSDDGPTWIATLDTSPASVWQTGAYDAQVWDSASTTLGADVSSSDTVMLFSTTDKGDLWATDEPLMQVKVWGQTATVQWMSGVGSIAPLEGGFETGITGWQAANATLAQSAAFVHVGSKSAQLTVTGSPVSASLSQATAIPVAASTSYTGTFWIYSASSLANVEFFISWYTAAAVFISTTVSTPVTVTAAIWTQITLTAASPGTAGLARAGPFLTASPPPGTVVYVDDVDLCLASAATGAGPYVQKAWVSRDPVVTGAIKAGSEIHAADPLVWSL